MADSMTKDDIKALRTKLSLSQQALAYKLGVSVDAVRKWEQGSRTPGPRTTALLEALSASQTASEGAAA